MQSLATMEMPRVEILRENTPAHSALLAAVSWAVGTRACTYRCYDLVQLKADV